MFQHMKALHEAEVLPRVVGRVLHDRQGLNSHFGTCVLIKVTVSVILKNAGLESYPVFPGLGPSTVVVVDTFDLQGRDWGELIANHS